MMPDAPDPSQIIFADPSKYRQLLLAIEGNQYTCCLKIVSPTRKSRSAILIFRGRVLGCIYGSKRISQQLFGKQAYEQIFGDMSKDTVIEAHRLSEGFALAAGSLFHSEIVNTPPNLSAENNLACAYNFMVQAGKPGCIVVNDLNGFPVVAAYLFNGKVIGVFSHSDGWKSAAYETVRQYLLQTGEVKIFASLLNANNIPEVKPLTFSLSGLADRKAEQSIEGPAFNLGGLLVNIKPVDQITGTNINRFVPAASQNRAHRTQRSLAQTNPNLDMDWALRFLMPEGETAMPGLKRGETSGK
jgi:hypothetical protein